MKINPYPNPFISLEGIDGCGKSTLIERLQEWDKVNKIGAIFTKEPTDGEIGQRIREILRNNGYDRDGRKLSSEDLQRLYIKDRLRHRKNEATSLKFYPLISDRDFVSTFAYGMAEEADPQWIFSAHELILGDYFFIPDLIFILDLSVEEAVKRSQEGGKGLDYFEDDIRLRRKVRESYLRFPTIAEKFYPDTKMNIQIIDASPPSDEIFRAALPFIEEIFRKKKGGE